MESNEQTKLTRKIETDSYIESRMTAKGGGGEWVEGLSKKEKGLMDNSVVIAGDLGVIRGLNGNGKNTIKIKF